MRLLYFIGFGGDCFPGATARAQKEMPVVARGERIGSLVIIRRRECLPSGPPDCTAIRAGRQSCMTLLPSAKLRRDKFLGEIPVELTHVWAVSSRQRKSGAAGILRHRERHRLVTKVQRCADGPDSDSPPRPQTSGSQTGADEVGI